MAGRNYRGTGGRVPVLELMGRSRPITDNSIVYRSLNGMAPQYLAADLRRLSDDVCGHHLLISSMSASRSVLLLETEPSLSPVLDYGTVCHQTLSRVTLCHGSGENLKHSSSDSPIPLF